MVSVTNFTDLSSTVIAYLERSTDAAFGAMVPTFIQMAEASMERKLRSRLMEGVVALEADPDGYCALPGDFIEAISFSSDYDTVNASIENSEVLISPYWATNPTMTYLRKFTPLSVSNLTNWVIENHPDFYLFATLTQACIWLQDQANIGFYGVQAQKAQDEIIDKYGLEKYSNAGVSLNFVTP